MKSPSVENSKSSSSNFKVKKPFFNQSGEGSFFSKNQEKKEPFINHHSIQPKLKVCGSSSYNKSVQPSNKTANMPMAKKNNPEEKKETAEEDKEILKTDTKQKMYAEPTENTLQTKSNFPAIQPHGSLEKDLKNAEGKGNSLPGKVKNEMEGGFGTKLDHVKVHTGAQSEKMNLNLKANAFTYGFDIFFNKDQFNPMTRQGKKLLAHEITHVVQQSNSGDASLINKQSWPGGTPGSPGMPTQEEMLEGTGRCPCENPFATIEEAISDRNTRWPEMRSTILGYLIFSSDPEGIMNLYDQYVYGRSSGTTELSGALMEDFRDSVFSIQAADRLSNALFQSLNTNPVRLLPGTRSQTGVQVTDRVQLAISELSNPESIHKLNYSHMATTPGVLAGDVGPTDTRDATVEINIRYLDDDHLEIEPIIRFTVADTIDFCPGDCGSGSEREFTVPMSQWEAAGITRDTRFSVSFTIRPARFNIEPAPTNEEILSQIYSRYTYISQESGTPDYNSEELRDLARQIGNYVRIYVTNVRRERSIETTEARALLREDLLTYGLTVGAVNDIFQFEEWSGPTESE